MRLDNTNSSQDKILSEVDVFDIRDIEVGKLDQVTDLMSDLADIAVDLDDQLTEALEENANLKDKIRDLENDFTQAQVERDLALKEHDEC